MTKYSSRKAVRKTVEQNVPLAGYICIQTQLWNRRLISNKAGYICMQTQLRNRSLISNTAGLQVFLDFSVASSTNALLALIYSKL